MKGQGRHLLELIPVQPIAVGDDSARVIVDLVHVGADAEQVAEVASVGLGMGAGNDVRGANQPIDRRNATAPCHILIML